MGGEEGTREGKGRNGEEMNKGMGREQEIKGREVDGKEEKGREGKNRKKRVGKGRGWQGRREEKEWKEQEKEGEKGRTEEHDKILTNLRQLITKHGIS